MPGTFSGSNESCAGVILMPAAGASQSQELLGIECATYSPMPCFAGATKHRDVGAVNVHAHASLLMLSI